MKAKIFISIVLLLFVSRVYPQFKINSDGSAQFKVNNVSAGFTGNQAQGDVSFGYASLANPSTGGTYTTAFGSSALHSNTAGIYNAALGSSALYFNTTGTHNTATGTCALYQNVSGSNNTANGNNALNPNTTGSYNTAIGAVALLSNTTGSYNTAIGYYAGGNNPNNLTNATAIGYSSQSTASNQVRIGNSNVSSIGGYANWSNISDGRAKKNIKADVPGLDFINLLQPVTYNLDLDVMDNLLGIDKAKKDELEKDMPLDLKDKTEKAKKAKEDQVQTGFVAQDVEKTAKSIGYNFSGVEVDESGIYALRYAEFVVPLVKAVQELSEQNDRLQEQVKELTERISELQEKNADLALLRSENAGKSATGLQQITNSGASLRQNSPNPFSQSTQIKYYLPIEVKTAYLCIYDLQGTQLKQRAIPERGEGVQILYGSELKAGIYLYTLIADGQEVDTKRMILTK
jgi:hypothetical protein